MSHAHCANRGVRDLEPSAQISRLHIPENRLDRRDLQDISKPVNKNTPDPSDHAVMTTCFGQ